MARFKEMLPNEIIKEIEEREIKAEDIFGEMVKSGGEVVMKNVRNNMRGSFESTRSLDKGLLMTKVYKTPSDDGINIKIGFYGYDSSKKYKNSKGKGVPIALIAMAREYGASRKMKNGKINVEPKKQFFRKSFKKAEIDNAMKNKQRELIGE